MTTMLRQHCVADKTTYIRKEYLHSAITADVGTNSVATSSKCCNKNNKLQKRTRQEFTVIAKKEMFYNAHDVFISNNDRCSTPGFFKAKQVTKEVRLLEDKGNTNLFPAKHFCFIEEKQKNL